MSTLRRRLDEDRLVDDEYTRYTSAIGPCVRDGELHWVIEAKDGGGRPTGHLLCLEHSRIVGRVIPGTTIPAGPTIDP